MSTISTGYNTHIVAVLIGLTTVARVFGWITDGSAETITALLLGGGLSFLRAGVSSEVQKVEVKVEKVAAKVTTVSEQVTALPDPVTTVVHVASQER